MPTARPHRASPLLSHLLGAVVCAMPREDRDLVGVVDRPTPAERIRYYGLPLPGQAAAARRLAAAADPDASTYAHDLVEALSRVIACDQGDHDELSRLLVEELAATAVRWALAVGRAADAANAPASEAAPAAAPLEAAS